MVQGFCKTETTLRLIIFNFQIDIKSNVILHVKTESTYILPKDFLKRSIDFIFKLDTFFCAADISLFT